MKKLLLLPLLVWFSGCVNQQKPAVSPSIQTEPKPQTSPQIVKPDLVVAVPLAIKPNPQSLSELSDVWLRIKAQIQIEVPDNLEVSQHRAFYSRHQRMLNQVAVRAEPFLFYIVTELERRQMPVELALLPIVESSYNPLASAGSPVGLWQIVPQTARNFGLQRNDWYDGRKDPIASTKAALDYLQYLYTNLGEDWLNAVAAYNSGEGRVLNAIAANRAKGKPIDFWSLDLPKLSTVYIPKWLALIDMLEHAEKYNVSWQAITNQPKIGFTSVKGPVDLNQVATLTQLSLNELKTLNPGFKRNNTPPGEQPLVLPLAKMDLFAENRSQLRSINLADISQYKVKSGDSLGLIAKKNNTTVAKLRVLNQLKTDLLKIGQLLFVSKVSNNPTSTNKQTNPKKSISYQIKSGDNLWLIAKQFKVTAAELAAVNKLSKGSALKPGQKLMIPDVRLKSKPKGAVGQQNQIYIVKAGDSLDKIAKMQKVKLADLLKWNRLTTASPLQPGQKLQLKLVSGSS
ncbi:MAG: LysM peptidoglycan-binding domain-containing protein [Gammaproteobacteria bacterium]|nr:LysM peptidoglycan-binding domain-containing protein [Gammaproteobacteria bacterium]